MIAERKPVGNDVIRGGNFYAEGTYCETDVRRGVTKTRTGTRLCCLTTDFLVGFRRAITDECGSAADSVFKSCGKKWGGFIAKRFDKEMSEYYGQPLREFSLAKFRTCIGDLFNHHGWGRVDVDFSRHNQGLVVISVKDPVYASIVGKSETPVEALTAGIFAGLFSEVFSQDLDCAQTACKACGAPESTFVIGLASRLAGVEKWLEAGKNHEQIMKELANLRV